ncbi:MAG TPA: AI-2E family transporter [Xanthomonadaceae bacterium]|nr:AI-2E family transporter [Xanthomonadaceae bacterium]
MSTGTEVQLFSAVERRLFRYTAVLGSALLLVAMIFVVFWLLAWTLQFFYNLLVPLSVAGILALVLFPAMEFLQRHLRIGRTIAILLLYALFSLALLALILLLVPTTIRQVVAFAESAPAMVAGFLNEMAYRFPGLASMLAERMEGVAVTDLLPEVESVRQVLMSYLGLLIGLSFVPLYLFFALLSGANLRAKAKELLSVFSTSTRHRVLYFADTFVGYVTAFFQGQLVIAMIMGAMFAVGFTLIGLKLAIPIGVVLGLLNVVPFLGTAVGILIVLPMSYLQPGGGPPLVLLALAVFAVVQLIESWVLTPKIMANRSGLPPALVVISVFFWGIAFGGVVGMILAVPLTAFFVAIWSQIKGALMRSLSPNEQ